MLWPRCLPNEVLDEGLIPDLRAAMAEMIHVTGCQPGAAVIFDMDHSEGTYAAAELLRSRFERVVIITPRDSIAHDTPLVTQQGILRRLHEKDIEIVTLGEPRWTEAFESWDPGVRKRLYRQDFRHSRYRLLLVCNAESRGRCAGCAIARTWTRCASGWGLPRAPRDACRHR